jgi:hypothetical protein
MKRYCYRCTDCLFVMFTDAKHEGGTCEACQGRIEYLGRVRKEGSLFETHIACACDGRCTSATGPSCNCHCGGENHGTNATVTVVVERGKPPRFLPRNAAAQLARAEEYRTAKLDATKRMRACYGSLLDDYRNRERIHSYETWNAIREAYLTINKSSRLRSHGGRMKALARVCPVEVARAV